MMKRPFLTFPLPCVLIRLIISKIRTGLPDSSPLENGKSASTKRPQELPSSPPTRCGKRGSLAGNHVRCNACMEVTLRLSTGIQNSIPDHRWTDSSQGSHRLAVITLCDLYKQLYQIRTRLYDDRLSKSSLVKFASLPFC